MKNCHGVLPFLSIAGLVLLLASCGGGNDSTSSPSSGGGNALPAGDSSISLSGPAEIDNLNGRTALTKPSQVWYMSVVGSEGRKNQVAVAFSFKPGFVPEAETYALGSLEGMERPDVSGSVQYTPDLDGGTVSGQNFSTGIDGTITFDSVDPDVSGSFGFSATDEEGKTATVEGTFKTPRPEGFGEEG